MMRGPYKTTVAVRKPDGDIEKKIDENGTKTRAKIWKLPIFRGCINFIDSLVIGMKALMFSAEFIDLEEEEETEPVAMIPEEEEEFTLPVFQVDPENIKTFLLVGSDDGGYRGESKTPRTDSMILCIFNTNRSATIWRLSLSTIEMSEMPLFMRVVEMRFKRDTSSMTASMSPRD